MLLPFGVLRVEMPIKMGLRLKLLNWGESSIGLVAWLTASGKTFQNRLPPKVANY